MFNLLTTLKRQDMQNFFQKFASRVKPGSRKDSDLTRMLVALERQGLLQSILQVQSNSADAKGLVDGLLAESTSQTQQGLGAYNKHTCFVFHALLIATIHGFRGHLKSLKGNEDAKSREKHAHQVLQFGRLLWRLAYSQMLTYHLQLLEAANFLHSPVDANMQYIKDDTSLAASHPTDGDEDEDENDDTAAYVERGGPDHASHGSAYKFRRWIQLLVAHWVAPDILSKSKGLYKADITLMHVVSRLERKSMAPWDSTIRRLASLSTAAEPTAPFDAERAIKSFTSNIQNPHFDAKIVKAFRQDKLTEALPPEKVVFSGNIHCEVALALLVEQSAQGDASFPNLVFVRILLPSIYVKLMSWTGY